MKGNSEIQGNRLKYRFSGLAFLVAQMVKGLPAMWETWVQSLGREDLLEEEMATHSSILAWKNPMDGGAWWSKGSQRVRHDWSNLVVVVY